MPKKPEDSDGSKTADEHKDSTLDVIVHPEDTIGVPIAPVMISLGLTAANFKQDVGGTG